MKPKAYSVLRKSSEALNTQPKQYDLRKTLCSVL